VRPEIFFRMLELASGSGWRGGSPEAIGLLRTFDSGVSTCDELMGDEQADEPEAQGIDA
jgi:hypothetical protein